MKIGIELKIDVTKIERKRLYRGEKGTYLTMTAFVDTENQDQYGNNGMITHKKNKDENQAPILGNSKVFWTDANQQPQHQPQPQPQHQPQPQQQNAMDDFDDDIPF